MGVSNMRVCKCKTQNLIYLTDINIFSFVVWNVNFKILKHIFLLNVLLNVSFKFLFQSFTFLLVKKYYYDHGNFFFYV